MGHPRRLDGISYTGPGTYFVTTCTLDRRNVFDDLEFGREAAALLTAYSAEHEFVIAAYCLMPDHAHLLMRAATAGAAFCPLVRAWKQATGYRWRARTGGRLWQPGYYERVLRDDESELSVARYVVENPVRAGLAESAGTYPLTGSSCHTVERILDAVQMDYSRFRRRRP
jgi:REP element-mobilizing transposase RayT